MKRVRMLGSGLAALVDTVAALALFLMPMAIAALLLVGLLSHPHPSAETELAAVEARPFGLEEAAENAIREKLPSQEPLQFSPGVMVISDGDGWIVKGIVVESADSDMEVRYEYRTVLNSKGSDFEVSEITFDTLDPRVLPTRSGTTSSSSG